METLGALIGLAVATGLAAYFRTQGTGKLGSQQIIAIVVAAAVAAAIASVVIKYVSESPGTETSSGRATATERAMRQRPTQGGGTGNLPRFSSRSSSAMPAS